MESTLSLTRAILVVLIPGTVLISPFLLILAVEFPSLILMYEKLALPFHVAAFSLVAITGTLIEGSMSYIEKRWDTKASRETPPEFDDKNWLENNWYDYLAVKFGEKEPVGFRYLSRKATELYFHLAMMIAAPFASIGTGFLLFLQGGKCWMICGLLGVAVIFFLIFGKFAADTHCLLFNARAALMHRLIPAVK